MSISVPPQGWYVQVTLPSGNVVEPTVAGDPSRNPAANDHPSLDIPVPDRRLWHNLDVSQDIPMSVYYDGRPQPIDGLEAVDDSEGPTVTLTGRGGTELEARDRRSVNYRAAHLVAEDIIQDAGYTANVDRPTTTVDENVTVQTADTEQEWIDRWANRVTTNPGEVADNDVPALSIGDGEGLTLAKTAWVKEAENAAIIQNAIPVSDSGASDGTVLEFKSSGDYAEIDPPIDIYTVPTSEMRAAVRHRFPDDPDSDGDYETPEIEYYMGGEVQGGYADTASVTGPGWRWDIINPTDADVENSIFPSLAIECISNPQNARMLVDVMVGYDARYHDGSQFDNSVDSDGYLASPTEYPIGATKDNYPTVEFNNAQTAEAVVGGRVDLGTVNDASGIEQIGLSNDRGESFTTSGSGVTSFETDFSEVGPSVRLQLTLSGTDATRSTATPTQGFERPEIDSYDLQADLEDLPLVIDQAFDDSAMANLQTIAETLADFIFEFRVARDGTESVEMTVPGQRASDRSETVSSYQVETTDVERTDRVVVKGTSRRTEGESFTADVGNWVALDEDGIQLGRSIVTEPGTNNRYAEGTDYDIDPTQGRIKALSAGSLVDGTVYEIDYAHRPSGQATVSGAGGDPDTEVVDVPALASDRACAQAAQRILEQVDEPLQKATVTIPSDQTGWEIVSAVDFEQLPEGFDNLEVREVTNTPAQTVLRLGSRESISAVVGRIRQQVEAVSRRA